MPNCFIIMPISTPQDFVKLYGGDQDHFRHVLECLFMPALESAGYEPIPSAPKGSEIIHAEIVKNLESADLVLCDISTLNPNVFFEFGIRTALNKPICLVKDNATVTVPFDASIINYHEYDPSLTGWSLNTEIPKLKIHIEESSGNQAGGVNSLWRLFGFSTTARPVEENDPLGAQMQLLLNEVNALSRKIERTRHGPLDDGHDAIEIDPSPLQGMRTAPFYLNWSNYRTISDFQDAVWGKLIERGLDIPTYTYGEVWVFRNSKTGVALKDAGRTWARTNGMKVDGRTLIEVGILPGAQLEVVEPTGA